MDILMAVLVVSCLFCGLVILAWVICFVSAVVEFGQNNGWTRTLKVFLGCGMVSCILVGVMYYVPWQGWAVMSLLLAPIAAAGAAAHKSPSYLVRPGFYSKVFDPPVGRREED